MTELDSLRAELEKKIRAINARLDQLDRATKWAQAQQEKEGKRQDEGAQRRGRTS